MHECVATTGTADNAAACSIAALDTWLTSTSMPSRFISATASRPSAPSPPCSVSSSPRSLRGLLLSASALWPLWVSVMYTAPRSWKRRSTPMSSPSAWPFSTAGITATPGAARIAAVVVARVARKPSRSPAISRMVCNMPSARACAASHPSGVRGPCGT